MQKNTEYNSGAFVRLTKRLRRRAVFVMMLWLVIGILAGAYVGFDNGGKLATIIGTGVGAFIGYLIGSMRSLYYNVQAMNALCLKRIEENTRTT